MPSALMWPCIRKKSTFNYLTMTKGNDHKNGSENSSEKTDDDGSIRNRTLSRIRTRSARESSSEDSQSINRSSKRRSWVRSKLTPSEGIVTRRRKRISSFRQAIVEGGDDSDRQKDTADVPYDETATSSSTQLKRIGKESKDRPIDSPSTSNETKTKSIATCEDFKENEDEPRLLKWETNRNTSSEEEEEDDEDDTKPLSTFVNREVDNDESKTFSIQENGNVTESTEKDGTIEKRGKDSGDKKEDENGNGEVNVDERSQSGLVSHDGDSCDSIDRKGSDSCSASVTSGDGSRAKGRNKGDHRPRIDFRVGAKIEARDCMNMWYPSKIIQVDWDDKEVLIHFERWNSRFDEWVSMDSPRLRAVTRSSSRKDKTDHNFRVFKGYRVGEVVLAKWADCKMYPAKILKILPDFSYNVLFYDGFERIVQSINVKKLPPEMIGQVNFKNVPPTSQSSQPIAEKRARLPTSKSIEVGKLKAYARRTSTERSETHSPSKTKGTLPSTNSSKGTGNGASPKKTKLLVGGIFQAKRHKQPAVKIGNKHSSSSKMKSSKLSRKSSHSYKQKKKDTNTPSEVADSSVGVTEPEEGSNLDVPRKQFIIEEDHNHFKCPMGGCGKGFRKESLLSSHIKHYHREVTRPTVNLKSRKRIASGPLKRSKEPVKVPRIERKTIDIVTEMVIAEQQEQLQQYEGQQTSKFEGNLDRKMITEKRRQLLLQKRLETVYKKRQQQALMEKNRQEMLEKSRRARKARLSESATQLPEKPIEKTETEISAKAPEEADVTLDIAVKRRRRRKKSLHKPFIGERRKRKRRILDGVSKSRLPDVKLGNWNGKGLLVDDVLDSKELQRSKRKPDQALFAADDDSTTSLCSENNALPEDKSVLEELTKEFKQFTRNRMAVRTFREWGESGRQEVVNCRCQLQEEEGLMMQCEVCLSWQHGICFNIEEEDKVPEKYICFACESPRGLRQNFRYRHHQDWFKRGEMASFVFLPKRDNWKLREDTLKTHTLSSQMIAINEVLRSLRHKLQLVKDGDVSSLKFWSTPLVEPSGDCLDGDVQTDTDEDDLPNYAVVGDAMLVDQETESWSYADHSYSNADHLPQDGRMPPAQPVVFAVCQEPEIEGIQITVSTSSPQHDESYEAGVTVKPDPAESSAPGSTPDIIPKKERGVEPIPSAPLSRDDQNCLPPKLDDMKQGSLSSSEDTNRPSKLVAAIPKKIGTATAQGETDEIKKEGKGKPLKNNLKKKKKKTVTKESSVYECQLNLLDHIEQLQEELDKRMDDLTEQLETLESNYESPATFNDNTEDRLIDMPRVKRLLKGMTVDLNKVRRMSLYC